MLIRDYAEAFEPVQLSMNIKPRSRCAKPTMTVTASGRTGSLYFNKAAAEIIPWENGDRVTPYKFNKKFMFRKEENGCVSVWKKRETGLSINSCELAEIINKTDVKKRWNVTVDGEAVYVE